MESTVNGWYNDIWIYINGVQQLETKYTGYSNNARVVSSGGRVVYKEVSAGDNITLRTSTMDEHLHRINFCAEYIAKINSPLVTFSASSTDTEGNRNK